MELQHVYCMFLFLLCTYRTTLGNSDKAILRKTDYSVTTGYSNIATTAPPISHSRWLRRAYYDKQRNSRGGHGNDENDDDNDMMDDDMSDMTTGVAQGKTDYWNGYYDFLINEGSYKFWAVFQLATAALLIYSGFAALYYAKVNPPSSDDYGEYFIRRRRRSFNMNRNDKTFAGLSPQVFQMIIDAVEREYK